MSSFFFTLVLMAVLTFTLLPHSEPRCCYVEALSVAVFQPPMGRSFATTASCKISPSSSSSSSLPMAKQRSDSIVACGKTGRRDGEEDRAFTSRRRFFVSATAGGAASTVALLTLASSPPAASAKYGESSSMELPSYIDYLIEKNARPDASQVLYQGADPSVLLRRLQDAQTRLAEISSLAEQKKWTQISGIVTGPLGTLSATLNQIVAAAAAAASASSSSSKSPVRDAANKVKADVLGIGQAADRKNGDGCSKQAELASQDLRAFLQVAFE